VLRPASQRLKSPSPTAVSATHSGINSASCVEMWALAWKAGINMNSSAAKKPARSSPRVAEIARRPTPQAPTPNERIAGSRTAHWVFPNSRQEPAISHGSSGPFSVYPQSRWYPCTQ
jgi:hypothetical protein